MNDQWPPDAPHLAKEFQEAGTHENGPDAHKPQHTVVTKSEIEALEKQRRQATPAVHLTPTGTRITQDQQSALEQRIKRLQERIGCKAGKARDAFERGVSR